MCYNDQHNLHHLDNDTLVPVEEGASLLLPPQLDMRQMRKKRQSSSNQLDLHHMDSDALVPVKEGAPLLLWPLN